MEYKNIFLSEHIRLQL